MLATLTGPTPRPIPWDASFAKALDKFAARYAPITPSRTCRICSNPIFSADSVAATNSYGKLEWTHYACENVNSGAEIDGSDAQDNRPTDEELNAHFLIIKGWKRVDVWLDPKTGSTHVIGDALGIQNERDAAGWSFSE